ncbi:hypothetical protein GGX14DRAFT_638133 [Mycena pura]|uniref:Uncharacterized protein n=1 Tax=Mycena pura TaxID=153505 RepID=A0AAD6YNY9_9AGAR|nr:hypothetical protein GGX14DRAFT_638133 [Mycena pura]
MERARGGVGRWRGHQRQWWSGASKRGGARCGAPDIENESAEACAGGAAVALGVENNRCRAIKNEPMGACAGGRAAARGVGGGGRAGNRKRARAHSIERARGGAMQRQRSKTRARTLRGVCAGGQCWALPRLWKHVNGGVQRTLLAAQLARSGVCGLAVRVMAADGAALGAGMRCAERWEMAELQMGVRMLPVLDDARGWLCMLRPLKYSDAMGVRTEGGTVPWGQVTRLRQRIPGIDGLRELASAHNLVALSFTNSVPLALSLSLGRGPDAPAPAVLPCLRTLVVKHGEFLHFLTLPALETSRRSLPARMSTSSGSSHAAPRSWQGGGGAERRKGAHAR